MVIFICQSVLFQFLGSIENVIKLLAILYNLLTHCVCNICLLRLQNCFQVASSYYCTTYYNHEVRYPEYYYHYYLGVIMTYSSPDFCAQYKQVAHNQKSIGYDVVPGSRAQIVCCTGLVCNGTKIFLWSHQNQDAKPTYIFVRRQPTFFRDGEFSWTLFFKMVEFQWTFSEGEFSWTLLVNSSSWVNFSWTYFG